MNAVLNLPVPEPFAPFLRYVVNGVDNFASSYFEKVYPDQRDLMAIFSFCQCGQQAPIREEIVGNGPYVMESYVPSQRVIFKRNPYYWRKDAQGQAQPYIERIVYQIIESTDNQLISFRSGQLG